MSVPLVLGSVALLAAAGAVKRGSRSRAAPCHACNASPCTCATTLVATLTNPSDADATAYVQDHRSHVAVRITSLSRQRAGGDPQVGHLIAERRTRADLTPVGKEVLLELEMRSGKPKGFLVVQSITINDEHRGLGWGVLLYRWLLQYVARERRALVSEACTHGGSTSQDAASVWNRVGLHVRAWDDCFMAMDEIPLAKKAAKRGSKALSSLSASSSIEEVAQPWKRLVGAARGGPAMQAYAHGFRNFPLDLKIEVVGSLNEAEAWLKKTRRGPSGTLRLCVYGRDHGDAGERSAAARLQEGRKQTPSDSFGLFSPFVVAHRMFDASYSTLFTDKADRLALTRTLSMVVMDNMRNADVIETFNEHEVLRDWTEDDCVNDVDPQEDEDGWAEAQDACHGKIAGAVQQIAGVYEDASEVLSGGEITFLGEHGTNRFAALHGEKSEEIDHLCSRVLTSLCCPTAAGRLLRLTDHSQIMADCYATHVVAGRDPLVTLTARDLEKFSPDAQVARWLAISPGSRATEVQVARYRRTLEETAVPVLKLVVKHSPGSIERAVNLSRQVREHRVRLIQAANDAFALQRVLAI